MAARHKDGLVGVTAGQRRALSKKRTGKSLSADDLAAMQDMKLAHRRNIARAKRRASKGIP